MAFTQTRNNIIKRALRVLGVLEPGETPDGAQVGEAAIAFNSILEILFEEGVKFWKVEWLTKTFSGSDEVTSGGTNYRCTRSHTSASSNEPGTGADWTTYWREGGDSGSAWATATSYSSDGDFLLNTLDDNALDIMYAFVREDHDDIPLRIVTRREFADVVDKTDEDDPIKLWVDRDKVSGTASDTRVYMWPQWEDTANVLHCHTIIKGATGNTGSNTLAANANPDFPSYWINALVYLLASELWYEYPEVSIDKKKIVSNKAEKEKQRALAIDKPMVNSQFVEPFY